NLFSSGGVVSATLVPVLQETPTKIKRRSWRELFEILWYVYIFSELFCVKSGNKNGIAKDCL
ncbi:MAG TPA: hypothetical protein VIU13_05460, partial [Chryseolinea sp.]